MITVPPNIFASNGSNFIFRPLTGLACASSSCTPGDFFGFAAINGGPKLSEPGIAYTAFVVAGPAGNKQVDSSFASAERNPNNPSTAICGHNFPFWMGPPQQAYANFDDHEALNYNNPNASGTFNFPSCLKGQ